MMKLLKAIVVSLIVSVLLILSGIWMVVASPIWFPLHLKRKARLKKYAATRNVSEAKQAFIAYCEGYPEPEIMTVYSAIQHVCAIRNFPIYPHDHLLEYLEIDLGDLDEMIEAMELADIADTTSNLPLVAGDYVKAVLNLKKNQGERP